MSAKIPSLDNPRSWINAPGPENAVVVSSRVRLARNLKDFPFPGHAKPAELKALLETVIEAARGVPPYKTGAVFALAEQPPLTRELLKERHLISRNLCEAEGERGLVTDSDGNSPLMVNEEDHIRLAALAPGFQLEEAWNRVNALDDALGEKLPWAFHPRWGFLTACPTNCGTGLRVSARLHLPALALSGELTPVLQGLNRLGLVVRGFYGEGTRALGEIFQISNATTLGLSEKDVVHHIHRIIQRVIRHETEARRRLLSPPHAVATEDQVYRAVALLSSARRINYEETMSLLSRARLGLHLGMRLPLTLSLINELMVAAQPAHIQKQAGKTFSPEERDVFRAAFLRKALSSHPPPTSPS